MNDQEREVWFQLNKNGLSHIREKYPQMQYEVNRIEQMCQIPSLIDEDLVGIGGCLAVLQQTCEKYDFPQSRREFKRTIPEFYNRLK